MDDKKADLEKRAHYCQTAEVTETREPGGSNDAFSLAALHPQARTHSTPPPHKEHTQAAVVNLQFKSKRPTSGLPKTGLG